MLSGMSRLAPLPRSFYRRDAVSVARGLLGAVLRSRIGGVVTAGRIVETEAYLGVEDRAAHTWSGRRTVRNGSMWGDGGHAYVYFIYGMHYCFNVVASRADDPVAVLVRALQPLEGIDAMARRRPAARRPVDLCSGPARLCAALGIDRTMDGVDLVGGSELTVLRWAGRRREALEIATGPRVGVQYAGEWAAAPLRFWIAGNENVGR